MNIYVGNLAPEVTEEEIKQEFTAFGKVTSMSIIKDKCSGQPKGFGFVEMPFGTEGQTTYTYQNNGLSRQARSPCGSIVLRRG